MSDEKQSVERFNFPDKQAWKKALQASPKSSWIQTRSLGGNKSSKYMSIPIQQALADIFFEECDVIDESYQQVENEILCTVKMSVLPSYPNAEHRIIAGTGAKPIAARSGSRIEKFPVGKITNSLEYCAPNARVSAIGNCLSTFGNIFGRNLGRAVSTDFSLAAPSSKKDKKKKKKDGKK
jgi:hypothetical protein